MIEVGRNYRATIETENGMVMDLPGLISTQITHDIPKEFHYGPAKWTLEMQGYTPANWIVGRQIAVNYLAKYTPIEWRCDWCRSVNVSRNMSCAQCGATRTFLYDLMKHAAKEW